MDTLSTLIESTYTSSTISFYLNGERVDAQNPDPEWTLLDFLRVHRGLTGTKLGCGEGGCGACTVVLQALDSRRPGRYRHLAVNACLFPVIGGGKSIQCLFASGVNVSVQWKASMSSQSRA